MYDLLVSDLLLSHDLRKTHIDCREDEEFVVNNGKRRAFHVGSNSSCRQHIRIHFEVYKARCEEKGLKVHHYAVPREMLKKNLKMAGQQTLAQAFQKVSKLKEFSREGVLKAVAEFVVCDDQVSVHACRHVRLIGSVLKSLAVAKKTHFRNCLVSMRPNAVNEDLPTTHDIMTYVHNEFISFMQRLKVKIKVFMPIRISIIISTLLLE